MAKKRFRQKNRYREIKEEHLFDKIFLLHIKKSLYIIIAWAVFIFAHRVVNRIFLVNEMFFFVLTIYIIPAYLLVSVIYTLLKHKRFYRDKF